MQYLFLFLLFFSALFLILLVLVQRGKGGGLAGALGGMGGQSAFGAKAGDTFTKITIGLATFWILVCILAIKMLGPVESRIDLGDNTDAPQTTGVLSETEDAGAEDALDATGTADEPAGEAQDAAAAGSSSPTAEDADATEEPASQP